jgi:hypothetical protein
MRTVNEGALILILDFGFLFWLLDFGLAWIIHDFPEKLCNSRFGKFQKKTGVWARYAPKPLFFFEIFQVMW